ncbi:DsbA family protein [Segnochrobactrum spirostomi]|uniref:DsbA family protein n=1 Tax=Segnochrobactrum spirostomi TaxID=2608987 RepID=A0A6A7Y6Z5_9HYPH|nr:DsbA family protein [Segnochrobactrum spirostomi]MQT15033.1 DsbA family protein [Segnochrobactrum spirostomi]
MTRGIPPLAGDDHLQGPSDAVVTLVEYGDYECPYCGEAYPVLKAVQRAMGPDLRFVFRNFPLVDMHVHARRAAEFAEAAAETGAFWDAHDMLFENQGALDDRSLAAYGDRLGIEPASIAAAFAGKHDSKIERDFLGGVRGGVNGTPCLFIDGLRYEGPRDVESLVNALRAVARQRL